MGGRREDEQDRRLEEPLKNESTDDDGGLVVGDARESFLLQ